MERKNKIVFTLLVAVIIVAAVLSSFGIRFFSGGTPEIVLPTNLPQASGDPQGPGGTAGDGSALPVEVRPDTVQEVIRTLSRQASYTRTISLELFSSGVSAGTVTARVWVDGAWTRVELTQANQPIGVQHTIVGEGTLYRWYGSGGETASWAVEEGDRSSDLAQRLPKYEDILGLNVDEIADAGYVEREGIPCVYVETAVDELGQNERYWVSTDTARGSGLLVFYQAVKGEEVLLDLRATDITAPAPADSDFTLPDGTVLHRVGG